MDYSKYEKDYDENRFFEKVLQVAKKVGKELLLKAFQLYYAAQKDETPIGVKTAIYCALGYFICPIDAVPDATPVFGYNDDAIVMAAVIYLLCSAYIDDDVRKQAEQKVDGILG